MIYERGRDETVPDLPPLSSGESGSCEGTGLGQ